MVTAVPTASKLCLDYGESGVYSLTKLNPAAEAEALHQTAKSIAVFQEGVCQDVWSYLEVSLEKD